MDFAQIDNFLPHRKRIGLSKLSQKYFPTWAVGVDLYGVQLEQGDAESLMYCTEALKVVRKQLSA